MIYLEVSEHSHCQGKEILTVIYLNQVTVVLRESHTMCVFIHTSTHHMNNEYICDLQIVDIYQNIRPPSRHR